MIPNEPPPSGRLVLADSSDSGAPPPTGTIPGGIPEPPPPITMETVIVTPSGVSLPESASSAPATQPPPPPQDTFVVPAQGGSEFPPPANAFMPQGVGSETMQPQGGGMQPPSAPPVSQGGGGGFRRILMMLVFLLLLGGLAIGGKFAWDFINASKTVTLTYWGLWENDAVVKGVIADFEEKNPKIKIDYQKQSHKQYRERLQAAIKRGDGPDIFRFHNTWVAMLANELATVPKTVMTASEFSSTFYPVAANDLAAGPAIYGLPLMIDGLGLYYNEDLFAAAGITGPPTTWEELLTMVPQIAKPDGTGFSVSAIALGTTGNVEHFSDILATMMMQNGANLVTPTGREAEETLIFYRKFADPNDPLYTWNDTLDNSIYAFATGKVAMILAPSWRAFDLKVMNPNLRFKIAPIPQLPGNTVNWASYWVEGVSQKSTHQEQAWEFVKYLTGREAATKLYTEESRDRLFGEPYARVDLASTVQGDPYVGAFVSQASSAKSFPLASRTHDAGINDKLIKYLEDAVNGMAGGAAPTAVLQTAAQGFRQVLGSYGLTSAAPASP